MKGDEKRFKQLIDWESDLGRGDHFPFELLLNIESSSHFLKNLVLNSGYTLTVVCEEKKKRKTKSATDTINYFKIMLEKI